MSNEKQAEKLSEMWQRLETVCQRLWNDDSPAAVSLQAVIEEFRGHVARVEQEVVASRKAIAEQRAAAARELEDQYSDKLRALEAQSARQAARISNLEQNLAGREKELDSALRDLAQKEAENVKFHDEYLKAASRYDEMQAKKMEAFYQDLQKKGAELETLWEGRQKVLENEYRQREAQLRQFQDRLVQEQAAWERQKLSEHEALSKRDEELKKSSQDLSHDYTRKQAELQKIKEGMQREIAEVVRQYQAKLRAGSGAPPA